MFFESCVPGEVSQRRRYNLEATVLRLCHVDEAVSFLPAAEHKQDFLCVTQQKLKCQTLGNREKQSRGWKRSAFKNQPGQSCDPVYGWISYSAELKSASVSVLVGRLFDLLWFTEELFSSPTNEMNRRNSPDLLHFLLRGSSLGSYQTHPL